MKINKKGFTIIELVVVIAVIAILSTIALFSVSKVQAAARDSKRMAIINGVQTALERYFGDNGTYPAATNFGIAVSTLNAGSYLVATNMVDPAGPVTYVIAATDWTITNRGVNYNYNGGISSYTLTLTREGGGSVSVKNPN